MIEIVPFEPEHLSRLNGRAYEQYFLKFAGNLEVYTQAIAVPGLSFSGFDDNDVLLVCAGILPLHPGVGEGWAGFSEALQIGKPSRLWLAVDLAVRAFLEAALRSGFHRIQTAIPMDFEAGRRWARRLGFMEEGVMKKYSPDGHDFMLYARIA